MAVKKVGIVMIPMLFGPSPSFYEYARKLREAGYEVITVDPYEHPQRKPPFFLPILAGPAKKVEARVNRLAASFDHKSVVYEIRGARAELITLGCDKIVYLGIGLGAVFALWAAEAEKPDLVLALYPHLVFPDEFPEGPPDFDQIDSKVILFYGGLDSVVGIETLRCSLDLTVAHSNVQREVVPGAKHAFFDKVIQRKFGMDFRNVMYSHIGTILVRERIDAELLALAGHTAEISVT